MNAALAVIARDGLAAASTRAIAAEAGLNLAALHYNFPGKDAVLAAVLEGIQQQLAEVLSRAADGAQDLRQGIRRTAQTYWAHVLETTAFQRAQYELTINALTLPRGAVYAQRQYQAYISGLEAVLGHLAPPGFDLHHFAGVSVAALDGLILQYLVTKDAARCAKQLELIIRGLEALCP